MLFIIDILVAGAMQEVYPMDKAQMDRLKVLLDYWIEHNEEHGEEFREWAEKARGFGAVAIHDNLLGAYEAIGKANALLVKALDSLRERA